MLHLKKFPGLFLAHLNPNFCHFSQNSLFTTCSLQIPAAGTYDNFWIVPIIGNNILAADRQMKLLKKQSVNVNQNTQTICHQQRRSHLFSSQNRWRSTEKRVRRQILKAQAKSLWNFKFNSFKHACYETHKIKGSGRMSHRSVQGNGHWTNDTQIGSMQKGLSLCRWLVKNFARKAFWKPVRKQARQSQLWNVVVGGWSFF